MKKRRHPSGLSVQQRLEEQREKGSEWSLAWWQLCLIGIGSIMGAGFFLGTGLSIRTAGPSLLIAYLIGGITAYLVFSALAEMTVRDPQPGSFRTYARQAFGPMGGFMSGWIYWVAGVLIMSSEVTALSIFTRFWFPDVPLWLMAAFYSAGGLAINLLGMKNFGTIQSLFAVAKSAALGLFSVFGAFAVFGLAGGTPPLTAAGAAGIQPLFPLGLTGLWSALIFVLFSYGGIEVLGVAANELRNPQEAPKAGKVMLFFLTGIYILSLLLVFLLVPWTAVSAQESPFVTALSSFHIPYLESAFNLIIITAAFSTMVGALYAVTSIMVSIAQDGDAPKVFSRLSGEGIPLRALLLSASGMGAAVAVSYFLPNTVYAYITTAAGILQILNWILILAARIRNRKRYAKGRQQARTFGPVWPSYLGIGLIMVTLTGALTHSAERTGFFIALGLLLVVALGGVLLKRHAHH